MKRLVAMGSLLACCWVALEANGEPLDHGSKANPALDSIMDYLVKGPDFPRPPADQRCALRLIAWDSERGQFLIQHYDEPTPDERAHRVRVEALDYLMAVRRPSDKNGELFVTVTPLGRTVGRIIPVFFSITFDLDGRFQGITRRQGY